MRFDTSSEGIRSMIVAGESETVEFKTRLPSNHVVARVLSAFANTSGGVLLIGVAEDGQIVGLSTSEANHESAAIKKVATSLLSWPIKIDAVVVDDKIVVFAVVEPTPEGLGPVVTSRGELFQREMGHEVVAPIMSVLAPGTKKRLMHEKSQKSATVFVAMSFHEEEEPALVDYFKAIERAVQACEFPMTLKRVDLVEGDYEISQQIMDEIDNADIILADFTLNSRNVYFELGYARGQRRRIIQTARKGTTLEFDVRNWRTIFYRNATELEQKIMPELAVAYSEIAE